MKHCLIIFLCVFVLKARSQDSLVVPSLKKNELGFSVLVPFIVLANARGTYERFSYLSFRHRLNQKHAVKIFTGFSIFNQSDRAYIQTSLPSTGAVTLHPTHEIHTPCNIEVGIGYEFIMGKQKLKHVLGLDLVYNNKFVEDRFYVLSTKDTVDANGYYRNKVDRLDSGAYTKGINYNKFGANLSYGIRYEFSKRWLLTTSFIYCYRLYRLTTNGSTTINQDLNTNGIISDVSIFYRF
jgi:hypothetical protein